VDSETEHRLVASLSEATQGISVVIASHRLSSFDDLDWVLVLRDGSVVEQGTPADLKTGGQVFSALYRQSAASEEMEMLK
ncbi:MAG: ABC transporter ATP-binding protein, partial [Bdellovibrionales bacterium]|nr:ABC transporter ATP-binding protein [Bdellovibrionales bacterium]